MTQNTNMTSATAASSTTNTAIRVRPAIKKDYYDIIAGLSAFEKSQDVILTKEELLELTTVNNDEGVKSKESGEKDTSKKTRPILHAYLGGKVDMNEVNSAKQDLSHTLLGGFVPQKQLESLSSIDFAEYFHKVLECEESLQIYDLFIQPSQNKTLPTVMMQQPNVTVQENTQDITKSTNPSMNPRVYQWTNPEGKTIKKIVICKRCGSRFSGQNRMKQLSQHNCKSASS